jgi:predicted GIY-YIG superfamily endonuclease
VTGQLRKPPDPVIQEAEMTGAGIPTTALYRFFDADGKLLYLGVSDNLAARFKWHRETQSWWGDVARKTIAWYGTRNKALAAEDYAIKTERPAHNRQGQPKPRHHPIQWGEGEREFFSDIG